MDKKDKAMLGKSMAKALGDHAEEIMKEIPVVGKFASKFYAVYKQGKEEYEQQKAEEENCPPLFMDSVIFRCKEGCKLSDRYLEKLEEIVLREYESDDEESLNTIDEFLSEYTDIYIDEGYTADECGMDEDAIWFNFKEYSEFPFNAEILDRVLAAFNNLLGVQFFDAIQANGHNEAW